VTGSYDFYFQGDHVGVDTVADLVDTAEMMGVIERGGSWYTVFEERLQGRAKVVDAVRSNNELFEKMSKEVYEKV
jgi:hypothetical protein